MKQRVTREYARANRDRLDREWALLRRIVKEQPGLFSRWFRFTFWCTDTADRVLGWLERLCRSNRTK
jgi:hypothetical protein